MGPNDISSGKFGHFLASTWINSHARKSNVSFPPIILLFKTMPPIQYMSVSHFDFALSCSYKKGGGGHQISNIFL